MNGNASQYNEVMRYSFYVDSNRRSSGTNTDLNLNLSQPITRMATDSQYIVSVTSVSVPFSFYQLSSTDNLNQLPVYLKNNLDVAGRFTTLTLQQGNYTPYTLLTQLNSKLVEACQQIGISGFTPFTPVFASTYNPTTGFITFSVTGPVGCEIVLRFSLTATTQQLSGFFGVHGVDVTMTPTTTQSSTKPCVLNPVNYLYLRSSLKQFRNREWVVKTDDVSDILHRIPIATAQGTYIQYDQPSEPVYIIDNSIDTINFYLTTNLTYEAINLQGIDWSFSFTISEVVRPRYTPITQQIVYNSFAPATDPTAELADLEAQKAKELERLKRYRDRLAMGTPEEDLKKAETPLGPTGISEAPKVEETPKTPDEVLKASGLINQSTAKLEEFNNILYGSVFDPPIMRQAGDVLGLSLNPVPIVEESKADSITE